MHKFISYIIIPLQELLKCDLNLKVFFSEPPVSSTSIFPLTSPFGVVRLSQAGLMRWQHRGHPPLYCSLFMLNLNIHSVPGHYLTPRPWAAAASLFNSPRWQEVRDCSELLSHTVSRQKCSSFTSSAVHSCRLSFSLAPHSIFCLCSFR